MNPIAITFGDTVRVRTSDVTVEAGLAGLVGIVHGETTPSVTGVDVVGGNESDFALNVYFESLGEGWWFQEELLEFIDHGAGTEIGFEGVDKKWVRNEEGEWIEHPVDTIGSKRRWWKFWFKEYQFRPSPRPVHSFAITARRFSPESK